MRAVRLLASSASLMVKRWAQRPVHRALGVPSISSLWLVDISSGAKAPLILKLLRHPSAPLRQAQSRALTQPRLMPRFAWRTRKSWKLAARSYFKEPALDRFTGILGILAVLMAPGWDRPPSAHPLAHGRLGAGAATGFCLSGAALFLRPAGPRVAAAWSSPCSPRPTPAQGPLWPRWAFHRARWAPSSPSRCCPPSSSSPHSLPFSTTSA